MDAKTALLIAAGLAIGLPYFTVAVLQGGALGRAAIALLFVGAVLLVVVSDLREDSQTAGDGDV